MITQHDVVAELRRLGHDPNDPGRPQEDDDWDVTPLQAAAALVARGDARRAAAEIRIYCEAMDLLCLLPPPPPVPAPAPPRRRPPKPAAPPAPSPPRPQVRWYPTVPTYLQHNAAIHAAAWRAHDAAADEAEALRAQAVRAMGRISEARHEALGMLPGPERDARLDQLNHQAAEATRALSDATDAQHRAAVHAAHEAWEQCGRPGQWVPPVPKSPFPDMSPWAWSKDD